MVCTGLGSATPRIEAPQQEKPLNAFVHRIFLLTSTLHAVNVEVVSLARGCRGGLVALPLGPQQHACERRVHALLAVDCRLQRPIRRCLVGRAIRKFGPSA